VTRGRRLAAGLILALIGVVGFAAPPAHALDSVTTYAVAGAVDADGNLTVKATLTLDGAPAQVQQRFATTLMSGRDSQYVFTLSDISASVGGQAVTPAVTTDGDYQVVTIPTAGASGPVELGYKVKGAAVNVGKSETALNWRLLQGLSLPVKTFEAVIKAPGLFTSMDCYAGDPAAPGACLYYAGGTHDEPDPVFHDEGLGAGEVVGIVLRFKDATVKPNETVRHLWSLDGAFSTAPLPLGLAAGVALLGGLAYWLLHRRFGRDAVGAAQPSVLGSFTPVGAGQSTFSMVGEVRPGEVGTLADERVDPIDVTASVIDLAVRNHVRIEQLPRATQFAPTDWALTRRESSAALLPYEKSLLDAIAPASGVSRKLSELGPDLSAAVPRIQAELYDEVVRKGWFSARPDATRNKWARLGWIALVVAAAAAIALIALTPFGLLGLVLIGLAAGIGLLAQAMPSRTAKGSSALAGLGVLRGTLLTQPTDQLPTGREHAELAAVLPYAVVLGGADRWLDGLAAVNDETVDDSVELDWYHGPAGWQLSDLPDSLRNFIRAFTGTLVARN